MRRVQGIIGWAALALVLLSAVPIGANLHVAWLALALAVWVLFAVQVVLDLVDDTGRRVRGHLALPALLLLTVFGWALVQFNTRVPVEWVHPAWAGVAAPGRIGVDPDFGRHILARLIAYAMLFYIALRAASAEDRAMAFVRVIALWSVAVAGYGLIASASGVDVLSGSEATGPLSATFVNRNSYATYAAIGLIACFASFALVMGARDGRDRLRTKLEAFARAGWLYALGAAVIAGALALTVSRGGVIAGVIGCVVFVTLAAGGRAAPGDGRRSGAARLAATGPVVAIAVLVAAYGAAIGLSDVLARLFAQGAQDGRFPVYAAVVDGIETRPLLGTGLGGFEDAFRAFVPGPSATAEWDFAHNSYLENVFELGLPAAVAFYLALAVVVTRLWGGVATRRRHRALPAFATAVAVVGALHSLVDFSLQMPAVAALFAFVLGLGWAQSFPSRDRVATADDLV